MAQKYTESSNCRLVKSFNKMANSNMKLLVLLHKAFKTFYPC